MPDVLDQDNNTKQALDKQPLQGKDKPTPEKPPLPGTDKPATDKPATEKPVEKATEKPSVAETDKPAVGKPAMEKPPAPGGDKPAMEKPLIPGLDKLVADKPPLPGTDRPPLEKPPIPGMDLPSIEKPPLPSFDKPNLPAFHQAAPQMVQSYDFLSSKKFSGDSLAMLDSIYTGFAKQVESYLAGMLRLNCAVRLVDVQEKRYADFHSLLGTGRVMALANVELEDVQQEAPALVHISSNVVLVMMDRMMGGPGEPSGGNFAGYTDVELAIFEKINSYLVPMMNDEWLGYYPVRFTFDALKHNPRMVQGVSPDDFAVVVTLKITVQDATGQMNICLPSSVLEVLFAKMESSKKVATKKDSAISRQAIFDNIVESKLELTARLEDTEITLKDMFNMKVGDVIDLNTPVDSDVILCVEGIPWFTGELGVHRQRTALKIKDPIKNK